MSRPAWRIACTASGSPERTRSITSWLVDSVPAVCSLSVRTRAGAPASASRHPVLPQRQSSSSPRGTRTWPRSPAVPWAPRWSAPPEMIPAPMPVATLTNISSVVPGQKRLRSPRAMMLTSLSTSTGTS